MSWLVNVLQKEARGRRYRTDDQVRYFTTPLKGKGRGIVLTPGFQRGRVIDYDNVNKRYRITNDENETFEVHPRNIFPESIVRNVTPAKEILVAPDELPSSEVVDIPVV